MTETDLMIDLHRYSERQGPGSEKETLKALEFMKLPTDDKLQVADIGCGSGSATLTLAKNINGQVTAIDLFSEFLSELNDRAQKTGLSGKINTLKCSMDNLPFDKNLFNIIWSEGAIYNIGFEKGIRLWKDYLKPGGYIAISEITWITTSRPKEVEDFWLSAYPEIDLASNKISFIESNGFSLAGYFYLGQNSWIENYYKPLESSYEVFLGRNNGSEIARRVVEEHQYEFNLYLKYLDYYSYGFYVARKTD